MINSKAQCDTSIILKYLKEEQNMVIISIIRREGSTPRLPGTRMLLLADGSFIGTIGGGIVEAKALVLAQLALKQPLKKILPFSINYDSAEPVDMICGGSLEVLIESLVADTYNLQLFEDYEYYCQNHETPFMCTPLPVNDTSFIEPRFFFTREGNLYGLASDIRVEKFIEVALKLNRTQVVCVDDKNYLIEPYIAKEELIIFGAGHISREICLLADYLGFKLTVLDDREEFLKQEVFKSVKTILIPSFANSYINLDVSYNAFLLIMTRGHQHDLQVLEQALKTPAFYIGMIGSRNKWQEMYQLLLQRGFSVSDLARVYCPVGIKIGAESPEEIAISIMAQLIHLRRVKSDKIEKMSI